nr:hypothetical protein [uncultured Desulfobacter sp.]
MKLIKRITVAGMEVGLVREHVWLDVSTPGRADFTVRRSTPLSGVVQMWLGVAGRSMMEYFTGIILRSTTVDGSQQRIFCRELTGVLLQIIPVSIRKASMRDILSVYSRKTGLTFSVPDQSYADTPCPAFQTHGSGLHGLDALGSIFGIKDYIWQQQGDGNVFAGSWADSKWADKSVTVPEKFFQDIQLNGTKTMQAAPGLRPGVKLNGEYITSLQLQEHYMVVSCATQLNA